jgi:hypothetical protein
VPDPIDPAAIDDRLVLGDLLMQRGDPLGELIAVHCALEALPAEAPGPKRRSLEARIARILADHHAPLFGALAPHVQAPGAAAPSAPALEVTWHGGFADTVSIESPGGTLELADIYRALRGLPLARFLRRLEVGRGDYAGFMTALGADPPPTLAELILHGQEEVLGQSRVVRKSRLRRRPTPFEPRDVHAVIDGRLFAALPALEVLHMHCLIDGLLAIDAPTLRFLVVSLANDAIDELALSSLPALESLTCFQSTLSLELLERSPQLKRISGVSCRSMPAILRRMIGSPCLASLRELALSSCGLTDEDLAFMAAHADRFAHLEVLDLTGHDFGRGAAEAAIRKLPRLRVSDWILR